MIIKHLCCGSLLILILASVTAPVILLSSAGPASADGGTPTDNLPPVGDIWVAAKDPHTWTGVWGKTNMYIGNDNGTNYAQRALLKFDLSSIPASATISEAKLFLYNWGVWDGAVNIGCHKVENDDWNEDNLTWNMHLGISSESLTPPLSLSVSSDGHGWQSWASPELTNFIAEQFAGDKVVSLCLIETTENSTPKHNSGWRAKEYDGTTYDPYLQVTYTLPSYAVDVSITPGSKTGVPGATLAYTIALKNTGANVDNYNLTVSDTQGWMLELIENRFEGVPSLGSGETTLWVTIPKNAEPGTEDVISVTLQGDSGVSDSATCITRVKLARWWIETVDEGHVYSDASIALDNSGRPHTSYGGQHLKYAYFDGENWRIETVDNEGDVGLGASIALDEFDRPHISYAMGLIHTFDLSNYDLKYAHFDGENWRIETVDNEGAVGFGASIALDEFDRPHISYFDLSNFDLKYAHFDGENWRIETVDYEGDVGVFPSMALDNSGRPHISYFDLSNYDLKYAHFDGENWRIETVDNETGWISGINTSIALDSTETPHICYPGNSNLKYAHFDGENWRIETVDSGLGSGASIALDEINRPHVSYYDLGSHDLKYAHFDGESWLTETVDEGVGFFYSASSIALYNNDVHISYENFIKGEVKHAVLDDTSPPIPTLISPENGAFTSDNTLTFRWEHVYDPSGVTYTLEIDNEENFSPPFIYENKCMSENSLTLPEKNSLGDNTYFWRVWAIDGANHKSSSVVWSFAIDTVAPGAPSLISPADNGWTNDNTPTFTWSQVSDPSGVTYHLQIDDASDFSSPRYDRDNIPDNTHTIEYENSLPNGTYYWRVRAVDGAGNEGPWVARPFNLKSKSAIPSQISPENNAMINDNTPTFEWSGVEDPTGITYRLQIDEDRNFSSPNINVENLTENERTYTVPDSRALSEGKFYWRVCAVDNIGETAGWSPVWMFTVDLTSPSRPNLTTQLPSEVHVPLWILKGTAEAGVGVVIYIDNNIAAEVTASSDNEFSAKITLNEGNNIIKVGAVDAAGNESQENIEIVTKYTKLRGGVVMFDEIAMGQSRTFDFTESDPLLKIVLTARNSISSPAIGAEATARLPDGVPPAPGTVYSYMRLGTNVDPQDIQSITLHFRVEKSWLSQNVADKGSVELWQLNGGGWHCIKPQLVWEDSHYFYYSARINGFSLFAVTLGQGAAITLYAIPTLVAGVAVGAVLLSRRRLARARGGSQPRAPQ